MRRLLLSSIKGVAVTAVRIDGVLHEFSTVPGVREDVIEILMNLKHIPIKAKTEKPQLKPEGYKIITIDSDELPKGFFTREENPGVITAKDLPWDNDFEFCGDSVLCTLEPSAHLVMEIYVELGVGYLSAERERPANLPVDALLTDAIFSPVKRVNYRIEPARVGQSIDFERLVLEVWTNGAISPEDSVKEASGIARDYFAHIVEKVSNVGEAPVLPPVETKPVVAVVAQPRRSIHELELSLRSENCLLRVGIEYIDDLLQRSHDDLLKIRNLGKKSLVEIENKLEELGLQLSAVSMYPDDEVLGDFSDDDENDEDITENAEEAAGEAQAESEEPESKPEKAPKKSTRKTKEADEQAEPAEKAEKAEKAKPKKSTSNKAKKKSEEDAKPETVETAETEKAEKAKKPKKTTKKAKAEEPLAKDEDEK